MNFETMLVNSVVHDKTQRDEIYAQNLYAAMCNIKWRCSDPNVGVFSITWRGAGDVVADLRGNGGSYLDWYCSGIGSKLAGEVQEGTVTPEVEQDLNQQGWYQVIDTEP